jgi:opacity protein-like surface antigen
MKKILVGLALIVVVATAVFVADAQQRDFLNTAATAATQPRSRSIGSGRMNPAPPPSFTPGSDALTD